MQLVVRPCQVPETALQMDFVMSMQARPLSKQQAPTQGVGSQEVMVLCQTPPSALQVISVFMVQSDRFKPDPDLQHAPAGGGATGQGLTPG